MISKFLASQLRQPSGWFGKQIISRVLNRDNASMNKLALRMLNLKSADERVLELGFGGGYLLNRILKNPGVKSVAGIDVSPEMVDFCKKRFASDIKRGKLQLNCCNTVNIPELNGNFTKICTVNTIYFWKDVKQTLTQLHQILEDKGSLVICFNSKEFLKQTILPKHGFQVYDIEEVKELMTTVGFKNLKWIINSQPKEQFICIVGEK
ncbi:MAG: class I SAM-dependent methyltransferase [Rivularia sp. (in: Bacteria)]|nr:class I SAM-dependent methyltransferase [Rivularia sp. MS3]